MSQIKEDTAIRENQLTGMNLEVVDMGYFLKVGINGREGLYTSFETLNGLAPPDMMQSDGDYIIVDNEKIRIIEHEYVEWLLKKSYGDPSISSMP